MGNQRDILFRNCCGSLAARASLQGNRMILNGKVKEARYFKNEVSKDGHETHIWLRTKCTDGASLVVFIYPPGKDKNALYPQSVSTLGAELSVSESLFNDLKAVVLNQTTNLKHVGVVVGSDQLAEEMLKKWFPPDDYLHEESVQIDEFSIAFSHPALTEKRKRMKESTEKLIQRSRDFIGELEASHHPDS